MNVDIVFLHILLKIILKNMLICIILYQGLPGDYQSQAALALIENAVGKLVLRIVGFKELLRFISGVILVVGGLVSSSE